MLVVIDDVRTNIWPLGIVVLVVLLMVTLLRRKTYRLSYMVCFSVFGLYLLVALDIAFFPIMMSGTDSEAMREYRQLSSFINLIPFNFNLSEIPEIVFRQMFQNILLTIPFGFGFNFVAEVRGRGFLWLVLAVGLGVELVQIVISLLLLYPHRVIDVNDAMLNTLGVLVGIGLFSVFARLYLWVTQRLGIPQSGLLAYIYEVASRTQMTRESLHTKMN